MTTPVRELADRVFARRLDEEWYLRLRRGLPIERLRVESEETWEQDARFAQGVLTELRARPPRDEDDRLTAGYLENLLGSWVSRTELPLLGFHVTPYQTFLLSRALQLVFPAHQGSGRAYISLVEDLREQLCQLAARLTRQREAGILVPRPALPGVRESLRRVRDAAAVGLPSHAPAAVRTDVERLVTREVLPSFEGLLALLDQSYERQAPEAVGMAQYPGGEEGYRSLVRQATASDLTPDELHQLGLDQVAQLAGKMAEARAHMGFVGTEAEFHARLAVDPRLHATSPDEVEALFARHMARLEPLIGEYFSVLPKAPYGLARLEPQAEAAVTYGYYDPPNQAMPVGRYRWNGANLSDKSLLTYAALIFHELAPGHHFHLARQAENEALPDLRREAIDIGAFNEGWAEYAAGLGWEMGLYDEPLDAYGRLVHERFTAQRLVVDTGMNLMGWSLADGATYMRANTTESDDQISTEVLRYATDIPAQALAYRAGFVELDRLRHKTQEALGGAFDVRDFHEHVLGPGALPFPVIEGHLDRWVATCQGAGTPVTDVSG
ncbi:MAG: DUF885 domain-containing protein [Actinomycetota bacterium]|nr:DUF885 domain-containing protein [Actinomycetota bacterium]